MNGAMSNSNEEESWDGKRSFIDPKKLCKNEGDLIDLTENDLFNDDNDGGDAGHEQMKLTKKMHFSSKEGFKKHEEDKKIRGNLSSSSKKTTKKKHMKMQLFWVMA